MKGGSLAGVEVPIIGSDSVRWLEVSVPSAASPLASGTPASQIVAPATRDAAACSIVGDPPTYLVWRIHESMPHALELLELCACKEFPKLGLRIRFPDALCPFAFICRSEIECESGVLYLLYALTVSGIAYLLKLRCIDAYANCCKFSQNEVMELFLHSNSNHGTITAVAATLGRLLIGRTDGYVHCYQLGVLDQNAPGFVCEFRDDSGIGRLWGLMSRGRSAGAVQDLVIIKIQGRELAFVLHLNGVLRVWDLVDHCKVFSQTLSTPMLAGVVFARLWLGETDRERNIIPVAVLHKGVVDIDSDMISVYTFHFQLGGTTFLLESLMHNIALEERRLINVNLSSKKIWLLYGDGLTSYSLSRASVLMECASQYALQDEAVAEQLFQSSEHSSDDLLWIIYSMCSSAKEQTASFLSSIFLRRLLKPGVLHNCVMRSTFQDYNKHWTDSEFQSLTINSLRKEILLLIEHEGFCRSLTSIFSRWNSFCARYFHNWCQFNPPCGFLIEDSTGAIGLIRKNSISLFRSLEDAEQLVYGSAEELGDFMKSKLHLSDLEREIFFEVLSCVNSVSHQLGKAASAIYYESLVNMPNNTSKDAVPYLLKVLETGYSSSVAGLCISEVGMDIALKKELADHKTLRRFSVDMVLSLHALRNKAATWKGVLDVVKGYLKFLVPQKLVQNVHSEGIINMKTAVLVQATSQVAEVMFGSAVDILVLLNYLARISGQIRLLHEDINRIQLELVPMIQEIVTEWQLIHFLGITTSEAPAIEDFSSQLSSLQIDGGVDRRSWKERFGKRDFVLAFVLLLNSQSSMGEQMLQSVSGLSAPHNLILSVRGFASWIKWGQSGEESSAFFSHGIDIAVVLFRHGQYDAVEFILSISRREKISECIQRTSGEWCTYLHLLGCCFLAQAHYKVQGTQKDRKLCDAVRCFFRASSGQGAMEALQRLSNKIGLSPLCSTGSLSVAEWKLQYYQWAMQIFEQYSFNEGASQFALAALEQVDEALHSIDDFDRRVVLNESVTTVKGRLWSNVFKFSIDQNHFNDAYCAIISNPDEESKNICLRRFIIVLYERRAVKVLCSGNVPFIGFTEQAERELIWKAERSDISAKPNPYKLLYAFAMHRHNWRRAASYIYQYAAQLKIEVGQKVCQHRSLILLKRLNGLSAAINALHLVHPAYAWIEPLRDGNLIQNEQYPSKKLKASAEGQSAGKDAQVHEVPSCLDIEKLEKEFILTSAEYLLSTENVKWTFNRVQSVPSDLVDLLVQSNFPDMAFTVTMKFCKDSSLKRELERVFIALSLKCCPDKTVPSSVSDLSAHGLPLITSKDEAFHRGSPDANQLSRGSSQWETLELYLEKYKVFHPRLPVIVAETLLGTDSQIELPLWLVDMFKVGRGEDTFGMSGGESSPASLFRIYVDFRRYSDAKNLLLDYIERLASVRPGGVIHRKRPSAVWFPYTTIERMWHHLEEHTNLGHNVDHCENLKKLLNGVLPRHLKLVKLDSEDAISCGQLRKL